MARDRERGRIRYGICLNDEEGCEMTKPIDKKKGKPVQEIRGSHSFVCCKCGEDLKEVPAPPGGPNKGMIAGIIAAAVIVVGGGAFLGKDYLFPTKSVPKTDSISTSMNKVSPVDSIAKIDTVAKVQTEVEPADNKIADENKKKQAPVEKVKTSSGEGTINLSYGKYTGSLKEGRANGLGTLVYRTSHIISSRDSKERMAEPGDYVTGTFENNEVVTVKWYGADKSFKGTIMVGSNGF